MADSIIIAVEQHNRDYGNGMPKQMWVVAVWDDYANGTLRLPPFRKQSHAEVAANTLRIAYQLDGRIAEVTNADNHGTATERPK